MNTFLNYSIMILLQMCWRGDVKHYQVDFWMSKVILLGCHSALIGPMICTGIQSSRNQQCAQAHRADFPFLPCWTYIMEGV